MAARKRELRAAAEHLAAERKKHPAALPNVATSVLDAWKDGTLREPLTRPLDRNGQPLAPRVGHPFDPTKRQTTDLDTFARMLHALGIRPRKALELHLAHATRTIVKHSPWRAVGWDRDPDWPPEEPGLAPFLVAKATRVLVGLPRLILADAFADADQEIDALASAVTALRILNHAGATDTFTRCHEWLGALTVRHHPVDPGGGNPCRTPDCQRDDCGLPLAELDGERSLPLALYLDTIGPKLTAALDKRAATWTGTPKDQLRAELYATLAEEAWTMANGGTTPYSIHWRPDTAPLMALAHFNRWPPRGTTRDQLKHFLDLAEHAATRSAPHWPELRELEAAAHASGFTLAPGAVTH